MRTIKYRAIIKNESIFREVEGINFLENKVMVSISGFSEWHELKVLSESTGLLDKNGKEIFEGDVLEVDYGYNGKYKVPVEFYEGRFAPLVQVEEGYNCIDSYIQSCFEIIGNIYENPETNYICKRKLFM